MLNQFSRTQLLIGKKSMDELANKTVAIFGVGGVGGYTVEALARSGVGHFVLIDDDCVVEVAPLDESKVEQWFYLSHENESPSRCNFFLEIIE